MKHSSSAKMSPVHDAALQAKHIKQIKFILSVELPLSYHRRIDFIAGRQLANIDTLTNEYVIPSFMCSDKQSKRYKLN